MYADDVFVPRRGLRNGHVMTIAAWASRRAFPGLPEPERRLVRVSTDTQVRADCYWQPEPASAFTVLGLHGLEGSSDAHYMRGVAHKAWRRGCNVVLLNQRNCGDTEHLTPTLYHSGLTSDPIAVIRQLAETEGLTDVGIVGYSLGGNLALKLAAELEATPDVAVRAVAAVSPTIDLALCVAAIEWTQNALYQWNFVRGLKARMRRKHAAFPGVYDLTPLQKISTVRAFDDAYTAPCNGFGTADNYYAVNSAGTMISAIGVPTLVLAAANDPFVPVSQFEQNDVVSNPLVQVSVQSHGGHCGFVGPAPRSTAADDDDGYWAESTAVAFLTA